MIILLIVGVLLAGAVISQAAETVSMPLKEHEARQPVIDVLMVAVIVVAGIGFLLIGVGS